MSFRVLSALLALLVTTCVAHADMRLRSGELWLVVASRTAPHSAVETAQMIERYVAPAMVVQTRNGRYAIVAGFLEPDRAEINMATLKDVRLIPPDAFLSAGEHFEQLVWPRDASRRVGNVVRSTTLQRTVTRLQQGLHSLGYYKSTVDGLIGQGTRRAVADFEARHGRVGHRVDDWSAEQILAQVARASDPRALAAKREADRIAAQQARIAAERDRKERAEARAQKAGFRSSEEMRKAERVGMVRGDDYRAFQASGFSDPLQYERAREAGYATRGQAMASRRKAFARLRAATQELLEDAALFARMRPDPDRTLAIARRIATITALMDLDAATTYEDIETARLRLEDASNGLALELSRTPAFAAFRKAQETERNDRLRAELRDERLRLADLDRGLKAWMVGNLLDKRVPLVTGLVDRLRDAGSGSDLAAMRALTRNIEKQIDGAGLTTTIAALARQRKGADAAAASDDAKATDDGVGAAFTPTDATRFLLSGAADDLVFIYNASGAPHIRRDLSGNLGFADRQAVLCFADGLPAGTSERVLRQVFAALERPAELTFAQGCSAADIAKADLFVTRRDAFLSGSRAFAQSVVEAIQTGRLRAYDDVGGRTIAHAVARDEALVAELAAGLAAGGGPGFAALLPRSAGDAPDTCLVGTVYDADADFHGPVLDAAIADLTLPQTQDRVRLSVEETYFAAQRGRCRVIYGALDDLARLATALEADSRAYDIAPLHVRQQALTAHRDARSGAVQAARLAADRERDAQAQAARQLALARRKADREAREAHEAEQARQRERAERIRAEAAARAARDAERARRAAATAEARTAVLRDANRAQATARLKAVEAMAEAIVTHAPVRGRSPDTAADVLPLFARQHRSARDGLWTPLGVNSEIVEFGDARWDGRTVEAAIIRVETRMENADLGRYRTHCTEVAMLFDDEFQRLRAVREDVCRGDADHAPWQSAHGLKSRWTVQP